MISVFFLPAIFLILPLLLPGKRSLLIVAVLAGLPALYFVYSILDVFNNGKIGGVATASVAAAIVIYAVLFLCSTAVAGICLALQAGGYKKSANGIRVLAALAVVSVIVVPKILHDRDLNAPADIQCMDNPTRVKLGNAEFDIPKYNGMKIDNRSLSYNRDLRKLCADTNNGAQPLDADQVDFRIRLFERYRGICENHQSRWTDVFCEEPNTHSLKEVTIRLPHKRDKRREDVGQYRVQPTLDRSRCRHWVADSSKEKYHFERCDRYVEECIYGREPYCVTEKDGTYLLMKSPTGDLLTVAQCASYHNCQVTEELTSNILYQWRGSLVDIDGTQRESRWVLKEYKRTRRILDEMNMEYMSDSNAAKEPGSDIGSHDTEFSAALYLKGFQDCAEGRCRSIPCLVDNKQVSCSE